MTSVKVSPKIAHASTAVRATPLAPQMPYATPIPMPRFNTCTSIRNAVA